MSFTGLLMTGGLMLAVFAGAARAQPLVQREGDIYVFDNDRFRVEVDSAGGARIRSWVLKPSGRELIAMWKGAMEYGGALDDRASFTSSRYQAAITQQGPQAGQVRFEVSNESGFKLVKTITVRQGSPALQVHYQFDNGSASPHQLFIRNFFLPGHQPRTADHLYWVNADPARGREPAISRTEVGGYYTMAKPEYSALWDRATGDAIVAYAPGADRFYFWLQAAEYPTFEWIYGSLAPGRRLTAAVALIAVEGRMEPSDWQALVAENASGLPPAAVSSLPGWQDDTTKFGVTPAEKERGFWLSIGEGSGRRRLPDPLPLDLPLDGERCLAVTMNALADFTAPVRVEVPRGWRGRIRASWQTASENRVEVLALPVGAHGRAPLQFAAAAGQNLWLEVSVAGKPAGEHSVPLRLLVGDAQAPIVLRITVWPVRIADARPFHLYGYSSGIGAMAGGFEVTPRSRERLERILRVYADMGGDVFDWQGGWQEIAMKAKIANPTAPVRADGLSPRGLSPAPGVAAPVRQYRAAEHRRGEVRGRGLSENLAEVAARAHGGAEPALSLSKGFQPANDRLDLNFTRLRRASLPHLDFSYYDPWFDIARRCGVTMAQSYMTHPAHRSWQALFDVTLGKDRVKPGTPEGDKVIAWFYAEMKRYLEAKGFHGFFCKIQDEITPEEIPGYIETAKVVRMAGWRPFTTITGIVAHTPADVAALNPYCDQWQVSLLSRDVFPAKLTDPSDEIWFYGGGENPYRGSYGDAWMYPQIALHGGYQGYAMWAFYSPGEQLAWIADPTAPMLAEGLSPRGLYPAPGVTVSPPYLGFRDGWRDAQVFAQLIQVRGRGAYDEIIGRGANASLRLGPTTVEVYHFTSILNANDPLAINSARRRALMGLSR